MRRAIFRTYKFALAEGAPLPHYGLMETRDIIVTRLEAMLGQIDGCSERFFGAEAVGDHKFMDRLRNSSVTLSRILRAEQWLCSRIKYGDIAEVKRLAKMRKSAA